MAEEGWRVRVVNLAVLSCVLRTTTKKGHQLFQQKSAPPEKILATPMTLPEKQGGAKVPPIVVRFVC